MSQKTVISAYNTVVNPAVLTAAVLKSELHWEMHTAQLLSLNLMSMEMTTEETTEEVKAVYPQANAYTATLLGLPVVIDNERYPKHLIRLMWGDREVARIESLAVPASYGCQGDWETEQRSEEQKFHKLTY